ncbi:MAG: PDZ domain-containing protein [Proteobacteria bacterium]|nr:PDZ domain-containing protein [Pseudomonadota bacterium]
MRLLLLLPLLLIATPALAGDSTEGLFERAFPRLQASYLHPEAMDPERMTAAGIQRMERASPEVLVLEDGPSRLEVWSGDKARIFRTDDVTTIDGVRERLDDVIAFVIGGRSGDDVIEPDELRQQALHGVLATVDRHSRLIVGDGLDEFNTRFKGTLVGIGARIGRRRNAEDTLVLTVVEPFASAPAGRAGLLKGDVITHIDGHSTTALAVEAAVDRIRGPEGVPVVLTVLRPEEELRRVFVIVREKVLVPSVDSTLLSGGVGLISIDHFSQKTHEEVAAALDELQIQVSNELKGIVIDLRGNTGGSMRRAASVANYFVDQGMLVRTEGNLGRTVKGLTPQIPAQAGRVRWTGPVAVLVNRRTASGSEIVAGDLKFLGRSITIGTQTFGKGTVQKIYPLRKTEEKVSMKMTVARYLLPDDAFVNTVGVTPDIVTGAIWLDPNEPLLPEQLREPPEAAGRTAGAGGLDSRKNPGGGREPTSGGVNAEPALHLWYPRVLDDWGGADGDEPPAAEETPGVVAPTDGNGRSNLLGNAGDELFNDVELRLAHEILIQADRDDQRTELIELARPIVAEMARLQAERMALAAQEADLAWAPTPLPRWMDRAPAREDAYQEAMLRDAPAGLLAQLHLPKQFVAGESTHVKLEVTNQRTDAVHHLRAKLESSTDILDGASFLLGDVPPGETRSWTIPVDVDPAYQTRLDVWRLYLIDDDGPLGGPFRGLAETRGGDRPNLALSVTTSSEPQPDGSAIVSAAVKVRNDGPGDAGELRIYFGDPRKAGVERLERFRSVTELAAGESAQVELSLRVRDPGAQPVVAVRLRASDSRSGSATTLAVDVPSTGAIETGWRVPPSIRMSMPHSSADAPPARGSTDFRVRGSVEAAAGLASVTVNVGGDQVFSRATKDVSKLDLEAEAILDVGPNRVRVDAASIDGVEVRRSFWVLGERPPPP